MTDNEQTPLDLAHAAMSADPQGDAARLAFYETLAGTELWLLLDREPEAETLQPRLFPLDSGPVVLAFDTAPRLADFAETAQAYAVLPGRVVISMLEGQGAGLGLNLGVAPSSFLMPATAVAWLAALLTGQPRSDAARLLSFAPPAPADAALVAALARIAAGAAGMAHCGMRAIARYDDGRTGHLLAFVGADGRAAPALARLVAESLAFAGAEGAALDVVCLAESSAHLPALGAVAEVLPLPPVVATAPAAPARAVAAPAPGTDPSRPPRLR